jgi:hypothetical protein
VPTNTLLNVDPINLEKYPEIPDELKRWLSNLVDTINGNNEIINQVLP